MSNLVQCVSLEINFEANPQTPLLGGLIIAMAEARNIAQASGIHLKMIFRDNDAKYVSQIIELIVRSPWVHSVEFATGSKGVSQLKNLQCPSHMPPLKYVSTNKNFDSPRALINRGFRAGNLLVDFFDVATRQESAALLSSNGSQQTVVFHGLFKENPSPSEMANSVFDAHVWSRAIDSWISRNEDISVFFLSDTELVHRLIPENRRAILLNGIPLRNRLALINEANGFFGTSTGPSTIALLGARPYMVAKHPKHHPEHVTDLLDSGRVGAFSSFSSSSQKFELVNPDLDYLSGALEGMIHELRGVGAG